MDMGYRCVEIDVWDGIEGVPEVTHGMTLTKNIKLEKIISYLGKYCFEKTDYPLVISMEMHCN